MFSSSSFVTTSLRLQVVVFLCIAFMSTEAVLPFLRRTSMEHARQISNVSASIMAFSQDSFNRARRPTSDILVIGVCGGTGAGKTTMSKAIMNEIGEEHVSYLSHDFYYKDLSQYTLEQRAQVKYRCVSSDIISRYITYS
jgi:pantothenate kinase-related protein Tda10